MALIDIPLYLTYGPQESNGNVQVVTTSAEGSLVRFKGNNREDATTVFKTWADTIIDNGRYTRLRFDVDRSTLIGNYTPLETHNSVGYERIENTTPIGASNEYIVKASNVVEYTSDLGEGPNIRYDDEESRLLAIPFQQEHASLPIVSIRPAEVIPTGDLIEMSNIEINAIFNNEGYLYYIVPVGPGKNHVHVIYGSSTTYPGERVFTDNTIVHPLDTDVFSHAFATDVELTVDDIFRLEQDPTLVEDVWDSTIVDPFSFDNTNMVDLVVSDSNTGLKYLPFSAGVQLYRGIIDTASHIALSASEGAYVTYNIPEEYYSTHDTLYAVFYDTQLQSWAQVARTGITTPITSVTVDKDHQGFTITNRLLTRIEMDQLCKHSNLLIKVYYDGYILDEGFKGSNIVRLFPGTEGLTGGDIVTDIVVGDTATIVNYTEGIRTSMVNLPYGIQDFYTEKDSNEVVNATVLASKIRFDISYLNSRFIEMFKEYTILDTVIDGTKTLHRIRTYKEDNNSSEPVLDKLYLNGVDTTIPSTLVTPDLPVALDGAGYAITIGNPPMCEFEVLPEYITAEEAMHRYLDHRDTCYS